MLAFVNERKEQRWRQIEPNPSAPLMPLPLPPVAWWLALVAAAWQVTAAAGVMGAAAGDDASGVAGEVAGECGAELGWAAACEGEKQSSVQGTRAQDKAFGNHATCNADN